jgi:uncharacterized protein (TIGR03083 family)
MEVPENLVRVIQGEAERLVQYLPTLPPEAWGQPSACERWEVRDVIGHLSWMAEFYVEAVSRAVQGDVSPPEGFPAVGASTGASFDEFIAQRAIAWRESLGDQLLPTFSTRLAQLIHLLATRTPQDWEKPAYRFSRSVPLRNYLYLSLQELALHGWAIRSVIEPAAHLSVESLPALMDRIPQRFTIPWVADFSHGTHLPSPIRYRWDVTGVVSSPYDIVVENGKCRIEPGGAAAVGHVTFRSDTETFVLLMYGRLTLEPALATGRLSVEGEQGLVTAFERWLKRA